MNSFGTYGCCGELLRTGPQYGRSPSPSPGKSPRSLPFENVYDAVIPDHRVLKQAWTLLAAVTS